MSYFAILILIGSLLAISYEDFKARSVHLYWFIAVFVTLTYLGIANQGLYVYLIQFTINIAFVLFYFLLLQLYFVVKLRRWIWITDRYIGWGDIVFIVAIAGHWYIVGFIVFIIISLIVALLYYCIFLVRKTNKIPLAGIQSIFFMIVYSFEELGLLSINNRFVI